MDKEYQYLVARANIASMSDNHIQLLMLVVQTLALIGLFAYCVETHRMRKAAQNQLKNSTDQLESYSKPCITFWSELREGEDVILQIHGATGNLVARPDGGRPNEIHRSH